MNDPRGSVWRKWDLHVHTPASLVHGYVGSDPWDSFLRELEELPREFKVIGINDYIFLDGYKRILEEKAKGRVKNVDLFLPVIELRLAKFGGSRSHFSRVNYHVIFSNELVPETIEHQFLNALSSRYLLTPQYETLTTSGRWTAVPTRQSLEDLGRLIIESVPETERARFGAPLLEGFNNLCINLESVQEALQSHYFEGKVITAVGKTEWADIKWNEQSIADKKTIINGAQLVFISSENPEACEKAKLSLTEAGVNNRLLDCSDAHAFTRSETKDRLGNCFTWIKADTSFEGLRQAVLEYGARVAISRDPPIEPLLWIRTVVLKFPSNTQLKSQAGFEPFCFRGERTITFSPYLTCVVGGRGTGKSTLLNLLHEKLVPGGTIFFKNNSLVPQPTASIATCVRIDDDVEQTIVEFLQQNEIEQFATDSSRLTGAIFGRLTKLDSEGVLAAMRRQIDLAAAEIDTQIDLLKSHYSLTASLSMAEKELITNKALVESFHNEEYNQIKSDLGILNKELLSLRNDRNRLQKLVTELQALMARYPTSTAPISNTYEQHFFQIIRSIEQAIALKEESTDIRAAELKEKELGAKVGKQKQQLEVFLRGRGLSQENLADVGMASERVAELEQSIPQTRAQIEAIAAQVTSFRAKRTLAEEYAQAVTDLLMPINLELEHLSTEVKPIELNYGFNFDGARTAIIKYLQEKLGGEGRFRYDHIDQMLEEVDFTMLSTLDQLLSKIPENQKTGQALRDYLASEVNFELLKLQVEKDLLDVHNHGRVRVLYDRKSLENTSFGQRCTAAIVVLLLLGNSPIVIDEPEAHLDSTLIAKYLVELVKRRKRHRQIIFATHNANFVVNGDAELIHALSMDDDKMTNIKSITIENIDHRDRLLALEGGPEAFQQRELRYGID